MRVTGPLTSPEGEGGTGGSLAVAQFNGDVLQTVLATQGDRLRIEGAAGFNTDPAVFTFASIDFGNGFIDGIQVLTSGTYQVSAFSTWGTNEALPAEVATRSFIVAINGDENNNGNPNTATAVTVTPGYADLRVLYTVQLAEDDHVSIQALNNISTNQVLAQSGFSITRLV